LPNAGTLKGAFAASFLLSSGFFSGLGLLRDGGGPSTLLALFLVDEQELIKTNKANPDNRCLIETKWFIIGANLQKSFRGM